MQYKHQQGIITTMVHATNTKPARIIAKANGGKVVHTYGYSDWEEEHKEAARKLIIKMNWDADHPSYSWVGCSVPGDNSSIMWVAS